MLQKRAYQKAAIKKESEKIVHYRLLLILSIAIVSFSYFHYHYHCKSEFRHDLTASEVGSAAVSRHSDKMAKDYFHDCDREGIQFFPIVVETLGWHSCAAAALSKLAKQLVSHTGREEEPYKHYCIFVEDISDVTFELGGLFLLFQI
jgi:hypothetical protein